MRIYHEFKNLLAKRFLVETGDAIIVGVSGGSDSVALLHLLYEVSERLSLKIIVAHINYHSRGKDSDADQKLVQKYAKNLGLTCEVKDVRLPNAGNFEERARIARYDFFEKLRNQYQAKSVAVAHTQDDQAETILMHFLKGAGLEGIAGMQPKEKNIIRPVLAFTKKELRAYLKAKKVSFRNDVTNKDNTYTRNKIRNILIPELQQYNPNLTETLARNAGIFAEINAYLQLEAASQFQKIATVRKTSTRLQAKAFETLPRPIAREVLHLALKKLNHHEPLSQNHFEQVYGVAISPVSRKTKEISRDLKLTRLRDVIVIARHR